MTLLAISLLGPFQVTLDGEPVSRFGADTARALLAYLAMHPGVAHRRTALAGLLWPERPDAVALRNLRAALNRLRGAISDREADPPFLHVNRQTIQFSAASENRLDVRAYRDALAEIKAHRHRLVQACDICMKRLKDAVELYRGEFLAGFSLPSAPFEEWMVVEREGLHAQALEALGALSGYHDRQEQYEEAIAYARRQVEMEPWREVAHRQWMRALALSGHRGTALAQYETCRRILREELSIAPEGETVALYERIRNGEELRAVPLAIPHNLPASLFPFVGRETLLSEIEERLLDLECRLLTLVGPGGCGKTRLALEAARGIVSGAGAGRFADGVFLVSLAPVQSIEEIVPAIAQAIGFSFLGEGEPKEQLLGCLRRKRMLLILDNYEHLPAGAGLVSEILHRAPHIKVLVTSRTGLNAQSEYLRPVPGMAYPELATVSALGIEDLARYGALHLFLTAAQRVEPGLELTEDELRNSAAICRLVEGMPLGVLLAATWVKMLLPAEIAREIERSLDFLETDWLDVPERQRSMRAVFDHSWRLLGGREREVLAGLSVFRGGCTRAAAQAVTGASLRELMALVERSLLYGTPDGRYEVHELLRQYAAEKLDQEPVAGQAVRDRHSAYYAAALEQWAAELKGLRQQAALAEIEADIDNARAAWEWAAGQGQVAHIDQAMDGLCMFYDWRGRHREGAGACQVAADASATSAPVEETGPTFGCPELVRAKVLAWQCYLCEQMGDIERADRSIRQSLTALRNYDLHTGRDARCGVESPDVSRSIRAFVLWARGMRMFQTDMERTRDLFTESLALYRVSGDRWAEARVLVYLSLACGYLGQVGEAQRLARESLAMSRSLGDLRGIAMMLGFGALSDQALSEGQVDKAERLLTDAVAKAQQVGDLVMVILGTSNLDWSRVWNGKFAEARASQARQLVLCEDRGVRVRALEATDVIAACDIHLGEYGRAYALAQSDLLQCRQAGYDFYAGYVCLRLGQVELGRRRYGEARQWFQEGIDVFAKTGADPDADACRANLGYVALGLGSWAEAETTFAEAMWKAGKSQRFLLLLSVLPGVALLLLSKGEAERAIELYALASRHPFVANSRWFEDITGVHIAAAAADLPPEVVAAAQKRGRAQDLWAMLGELLAELAAITDGEEPGLHTAPL